jgi:hypothetical protein
MTPLERGFVRCARKEGKTWDFIADALHRDPDTLKRALKTQRALLENAQTIRKQNQRANLIACAISSVSSD